MIDPEGRYLAEKYRISYIQSLAVMDIVNKRNYSSNRKPLLGFGGAVYNPIHYEGELLKNERQLAQLKKTIYSSGSRSSLRQFYGALGLKWDNLPGTLSEVQKISEIVPNSEIISGIEVNEANVKKLSASGQLDKYKVIHFATHGITIPKAPELSSLVLSQLKDDSKEDGYLTIPEISKLTQKADFINLSACETGLGKIYNGEGVFGLMHAFMIAGSNSLSVSLWQVDDKATSIFMQELYRLVQTEKMTYANAMTMVKRKFIYGNFGQQYQDPMFWSAFAYYGRIL